MNPFLKLLCIFLIGLLWACQPPPQEHEATRFIMDTIVSIKTPAIAKQAALDQAFTQMEQDALILGKFAPQSPLFKLNARQTTELPPLAIDLIRQAIAIAEQTNGAFDITMGSLTALWRINKDFVPPPAPLVAQALATIGYQKLHISDTSITLPEGMQLDLGGIAKGRIVDRAAAYLRQQGLQDFLINAGGDILLSGKRSYQVGIKHPRGEQQISEVINLQGPIAIVTSGDYEQFIEIDGQRYHHIISPFDGYPATSATSVTVVAPDCTTADAWATAVFVLPTAEAIALVNKSAGIECMVIDQQLVTHYSAGWDYQ